MDWLALWPSMIGAIVGGSFALTGAFFALRGERNTALRVLKVQESQHVADELPTAFHAWARAIAKLHLTGLQAMNDELQEVELVHRMRVLSLRHRLPVEDDEIAAEIDKAITGYTSWVSSWMMKPKLTPDDLQLPENISMAITAALILVTANLPGRVREELNRRR